MDEVRIGCIGFHYLLETYLDGSKREKRRWGTHPVLSSRLCTGTFHNTFTLHRQYEDKFFQYYRMSVCSFDELLGLVCEEIQKIDTNMKQSIQPVERLVITLRYLATGTNFGAIEYGFQVSRNTVRQIVKESCAAIWKALQPREMPTPTAEMWLEKAGEYEKLCNFPNYIGAVDVLLAVSDAQYNFTAIDVGAYGREGDSTIFKNSNFYQRLKSDQLNIPAEKPLPSDGPVVPFVLLGDEAFVLSRCVMRPYPQKKLTKEKRIYNYRHCRARRTVECAFGILSNKWRIMHSVILLNPEFATTIIQCCCVLHNYVKKRDGLISEDSLICEMVDFEDTSSVGGRCSGLAVRDFFTEYFNGPGAVSWQDKYT